MLNYWFNTSRDDMTSCLLCTVAMKAFCIPDPVNMRNLYHAKEVFHSIHKKCLHPYCCCSSISYLTLSGPWLVSEWQGLTYVCVNKNKWRIIFVTRSEKSSGRRALLCVYASMKKSTTDTLWTLIHPIKLNWPEDLVLGHPLLKQSPLAAQVCGSKELDTKNREKTTIRKHVALNDRA